MGAIIAEGRSADTTLQIVTVLLAYISGKALVVEVEDTDPQPADWWKLRAPELARMADRARFRMVFSVSGPPSVDRIFQLGMERILDGLAPVITAAG